MDGWIDFGWMDRFLMDGWIDFLWRDGWMYRGFLASSSKSSFSGISRFKNIYIFGEPIKKPYYKKASV